MEESNPCVEQNEGCPLSKNKLRKSRKYVKRLENRKAKRAIEKSKKKELKKIQTAIQPRKFRGNDEKLEASQKLKEALKTGPKVVIDCQYEGRMSEKERKRFAQQIRRVYSSNRISENPLHLYLTSLSEDSSLHKICCQQNSGFAQYVLDVTSKNVMELFRSNGSSSESRNEDEIVYLSPDSKNELEEFNPNKVYIIGGIVDETTTKNLSQRIAKGANISTARIPIDKYFRRSVGGGTFKQVLTINQVVDIILEWHRTKDWVQAIQAGLPTRTGFVPAPVANN